MHAPKQREKYSSIMVTPNERIRQPITSGGPHPCIQRRQSIILYTFSSLGPDLTQHQNSKEHNIITCGMNG